MVDGDEWKNKTPWKCLEEQSVKKQVLRESGHVNFRQ